MEIECIPKLPKNAYECSKDFQEHFNHPDISDIKIRVCKETSEYMGDIYAHLLLLVNYIPYYYNMQSFLFNRNPNISIVHTSDFILPCDVITLDETRKFFSLAYMGDSNIFKFLNGLDIESLRSLRVLSIYTAWSITIKRIDEVLMKMCKNDYTKLIEAIKSFSKVESVYSPEFILYIESISSIHNICFNYTKCEMPSSINTHSMEIQGSTLSFNPLRIIELDLSLFKCKAQFHPVLIPSQEFTQIVIYMRFFENQIINESALNTSIQVETTYYNITTVSTGKKCIHIRDVITESQRPTAIVSTKNPILFNNCSSIDGILTCLGFSFSLIQER